MNPLLICQSETASRNGELLPIGAILPDVLRRYDLLLPFQSATDSRDTGSADRTRKAATTASRASADGILY